MLFNKRLTDFEFSDIKELEKSQIEESDILDYKEKIDDDNVLKEVVAFSNSRGGYLIYGIKESGRAVKGGGRGSYPESITGIDKSCNCERLENIIIGNIMPRVNVQFQKIPIPDSDKIILVIHIPEGQNKPYYSSNGNRYFKRYNFQASPMMEHEIEAMYRERFFGVSNLARYVNEVVSFNKNFIPLEKRPKIIDCHIIVSPLRIEDRIIDFTDGMRIGQELRESNVTIRNSSRYLCGIEEPSKYGIKWADSIMSQIVEVHRNGLVYCMGESSSLDSENTLQFYEGDFCNYLLNTILFSDTVYSKFNFVGKVKIIAKIMNCANSVIYIPSYQIRREPNKCYAEEIIIEREWDSWKLKDDYLKIGKSIMDEAANCYGLWKSRYLIEKDGTIQIIK